MVHSRLLEKGCKLFFFIWLKFFIARYQNKSFDFTRFVSINFLIGKFLRKGYISLFLKYSNIIIAISSYFWPLLENLPDLSDFPPWIPKIFFDGSDFDFGLKWVGDFDPLKAIQGRCILILNNINQLTNSIFQLKI